MNIRSRSDTLVFTCTIIGVIIYSYLSQDYSKSNYSVLMHCTAVSIYEY